MERVLRAFELAKDGRGRRAYVAWLEARAATAGEKAMRGRQLRFGADGIMARILSKIVF
jgi:hypothetical protein